MNESFSVNNIEYNDWLRTSTELVLTSNRGKFNWLKEGVLMRFVDIVYF